MTYKEAVAEALLRARKDRILRRRGLTVTADTAPALIRLAAQRWPALEETDNE
jgi:hypothetical protein